MFEKLSVRITSGNSEILSLRRFRRPLQPAIKKALRVVGHWGYSAIHMVPNSPNRLLFAQEDLCLAKEWILATWQCVQVVKEMDSKSIGVGDEGFESLRCHFWKIRDFWCSFRVDAHRWFCSTHSIQSRNRQVRWPGFLQCFRSGLNGCGPCDGCSAIDQLVGLGWATAAAIGLLGRSSSSAIQLLVERSWSSWSSVRPIGPPSGANPYPPPP